MEIKANQKNCAAMQNRDLPGQRIVFELARFHVAHHPRNRRQVVEVSQKELVTERIIEKVDENVAEKKELLADNESQTDEVETSEKEEVKTDE